MSTRTVSSRGTLMKIACSAGTGHAPVLFGTKFTFYISYCIFWAFSVGTTSDIRVCGNENCVDRLVFVANNVLSNYTCDEM